MNLEKSASVSMLLSLVVLMIGFTLGVLFDFDDQVLLKVILSISTFLLAIGAICAAICIARS